MLLSHGISCSSVGRASDPKNLEVTGSSPVKRAKLFIMSKEKEKQNGQAMNQKIMERLNKYNKEKDGRGTEKSKGESK